LSTDNLQLGNQKKGDIVSEHLQIFSAMSDWLAGGWISCWFPCKTLLKITLTTQTECKVQQVIKGSPSTAGKWKDFS